MESIIAILEKIEAPLLFSSRDSYLHLPLIKSLEATMRSFLKQLENISFADSIQSETYVAYKSIISGFEEAISGFDKLPLEDKKERIEIAMRVLHELRVFVEKYSIGISCIQEDEGAEDQKNYETSLEKLSLSLRFVKGVGPKMASLLEKKGLKTVEDLLYFVPRRYEDRRTVRDIKSVEVGRTETVIGHVVSALYRSYRNRRTYEVTVEDGSGLLTAKWFRGNLTYMRKIFRKGVRVILTGEVSS